MPMNQRAEAWNTSAAASATRRDQRVQIANTNDSSSATTAAAPACSSAGDRSMRNGGAKPGVDAHFQYIWLRRLSLVIQSEPQCAHLPQPREKEDHADQQPGHTQRNTVGRRARGRRFVTPAAPDVQRQRIGTRAGGADRREPDQVLIVIGHAVAQRQREQIERGDDQHRERDAREQPGGAEHRARDHRDRCDARRDGVGWKERERPAPPARRDRERRRQARPLRRVAHLTGRQEQQRHDDPEHRQVQGGVRRQKAADA